jgi:hypothetical protein
MLAVIRPADVVAPSAPSSVVLNSARTPTSSSAEGATTSGAPALSKSQEARAQSQEEWASDALVG